MDSLSPWKRIFIWLYRSLFRFAYKLYSFKNKGKREYYLFALYRTDKPEGNLGYVYDELLRQVPNAKVRFIRGANKWNLSMLKEIPYLAEAKCVILDDYYLPVYLIKEDQNLKIVQLWHAAGAFKKFGYSTIGTNFGPNPAYLKLVPIHATYTHVYVSSTSVVPFYAEAFNLPQERVIPIGVPRTDLFTSVEDVEAVEKKLFSSFPIWDNADTVRVLIAPTYRAGGAQRESNLNMEKVIKDIAKVINPNVQIIYKAHPYTPVEELDKLAEFSNVLVASSGSINEWMLIADAFMTDYSSSVFEFALLKKPFAHFIPDLHEYETNRGLYQQLEVISDGAMLETSEQLVEWINARSKNEYFDSSRMVSLNFDNTSRVSELIVRDFK
ncbi:CDP-glycerol glycerophosphotransferase family protein [Terribacillus halophilus]|jgi:teichoic acid ribitol-phosphate primase|uniref:CDP-glycerol glycerophosphotransferase family protein n=1 Tax=Terribacillus halophilus TaxID=361279 RepID=UPI000984BC6C|nr:CDP-glycerol glycerophosphotransferase family protein [Terribacillus halophilus]